MLPLDPQCSDQARQLAVAVLALFIADRNGLRTAVKAILIWMFD
jgi:hypothetical protein